MSSLSPLTFLLGALASSTFTTFYQCACLPSRHALWSRTSICTCMPNGLEQAHYIESEEITVNEVPKFRWNDVGSDLSDSQRQAIRNLSPKLSNRCKALMTHLICLSPEGQNLHMLLAFWVKAMKPKRADWLLILKELKIMESSLLTEVMEYALLEDSFEANVRDYTKMIHIYGKQNLVRQAENALYATKSRGFPCDHVMLTALIDLYSKAGDLARAKETFEEIKLLGLPLDKRAYGSMTMAYIRADMLDKAENLLKEMEDQQVYAGKEVYKALLRAYSYKADSYGAQRVFNAIQFAGIVPDTKLCALLVNAYCLSNQIEEAVSVIRNMRNAGMRPCDKCIALILSAYEKESSLQRALAFLIELEENGIVIGEEPSQLLAGWFRRLGVVHEVEQVLRELSGGRKSDHSLAMPLEQK